MIFFIFLFWGLGGRGGGGEGNVGRWQLHHEYEFIVDVLGVPLLLNE